MLRFIFKNPGTCFFLVVGALMNIGSRINDAYTLVNARLPAQLWEAIGAGVFFLTVIVLLYRWDKDRQVIPASQSAHATAQSINDTPLKPSAIPDEPRNALPKHRAEFLKNIQYGWGDAQIPLSISGIVATTTDRLRIVLDVSSPLPGLGTTFYPAQFVSIKDLKDEIVRGVRVEVQLIFGAVNAPNPGFGPAYFWGDPKKNYPVMPMNKVRVRLIGGHGEEQHIYFFAIAGLGGQPITVLPEADLDWVNQWRAQDT